MVEKRIFTALHVINPQQSSSQRAFASIQALCGSK
jgi:hypothetical protein